MSEQIAVRLSNELLQRLDALVTQGRYASRAEAVRAGIEHLDELDRRRRLDGAIVAGYRRIPPANAETEAAAASLRAAILEEPW